VPILPADLIFKTLMEKRLMTYESLSDGFATGSSLLDQEDIVYNDSPVNRNNGIFLVLSP
jgi:hypothetical protein